MTTGKAQERKESGAEGRMPERDRGTGEGGDAGARQGRS